MNIMRVFVLTLLFIFSFMNPLYATQTLSGGICIVTVSKNVALNHQPGQILQGKIGTTLPGKSINLTLPTNKSFNQLEKDDLLLAHGVIHKVQQKQQQSDGSFKLTLHPTKLIIDQKQKLK